MGPNKEIVIKEILQEMDFGTERAVCLSQVVEKWRVSSRTFDRYWSEAHSRFKAANEKDEKVFDDVRVQMKAEALKAKILGKIERMEILSSIADGSLTFQKEVPSKFGPQVITATPDYSDRRAALAELNKMDGEYAPIRKDITTGGEQLPAPVFNIILDDGEL
jgi:hypothetical protein